MYFERNYTNHSAFSARSRTRLRFLLLSLYSLLPKKTPNPSSFNDYSVFMMSIFLLIQISPVISISWICWMIREFKTPEIEFAFSMTHGLKLAAHR